MQSQDLVNFFHMQSQDLVNFFHMQSQDLVNHFLSSVFTVTFPTEVFKCELCISLNATIQLSLLTNCFWRDVNDIFGLPDFTFKFG